MDKLFWNALTPLRDMADTSTLFDLILLEAGQVALGENVVLEGDANPVQVQWSKLAERSEHAFLQAAARELMMRPPRERLAVLDELYDMMGLRARGATWMTSVPAEMLSEFVRDCSSVRCSFGWSLRPALTTALNAVETGRSCHVRFIDQDASLCFRARMCAAVLGVEVEVVHANPRTRADNGKFDGEISMPPFGERIAVASDVPTRVLDRLGVSEATARLTSEAVAVADALVHIDGHAVIGVPDGVLFRNVGVETAAREELLASHRLVAVLAAPGGMVDASLSIRTNFLVIAPKGAQHHAVRMVDLSAERFSTRTARGRATARREASWLEAVASPFSKGETNIRDVTLDEIHQNAHVLTVDRYLRSPKSSMLGEFLERYETAHLGDVVEIIRPAALSRADEGVLTVHETSPADIGSRGVVQTPARVVTVDAAAARTARNQQVLAGDVVLSVKGTIGAVGLVDAKAPERGADPIWVVGQSMVILRPKSMHISSLALYEYLSSDAAQDLLRSLAAGATIQSITARDIREIEVPIPHEEIQNQIELDFLDRQALHDEIARLEQQLARARRQTWPHRELSRSLEDQT